QAYAKQLHLDRNQGRLGPSGRAEAASEVLSRAEKAMQRFKETALRDVVLTARVWVAGLIDLPPDIQAEQGRMPWMVQNELHAKLLKGQIRDDVASVDSVASGTDRPGTFIVPHPVDRK